MEDWLIDSQVTYNDTAFKFKFFWQMAYDNLPLELERGIFHTKE